MQANMHLRVRPAEAAQARETVRKPEGRFAKFNNAMAKFVTFHSDEKLVQMDSPYRWVQ